LVHPPMSVWPLKENGTLGRMQPLSVQDRHHIVPP